MNLVATWRASSTNMAVHLFKLSLCVSVCVLDKDMHYMMCIGVVAKCVQSFAKV